jgi:hypothetical protein
MTKAKSKKEDPRPDSPLKAFLKMVLAYKENKTWPGYAELEKAHAELPKSDHKRANMSAIPLP